MLDPMTMRCLRGFIRWIMPIPFAALIAGCAVTPEPLTPDELESQVQKDMERLFLEETESLPKVLTLSEAIARALKYNLDHRVKMIEEALALDRIGMDNIELLLPDLVAKAGYRRRDKRLASKSSTLAGKEDPDYKYSSEKGSVTTDLTSRWNMLDFGVSYYTAKQNTDHALIADEQRRKATHNLMQEVRSVYWCVVAFQVLDKPIRDTLDLARHELANADTQLREKLGKPLETNRYKRMLLKNIQELESIRKELSTARITLASLIRARPGTEIQVAIPNQGDLQPPEWDIPIGEMERLAFLNNPDIRVGFYESRIAIRETYKAIARTLPGIELTASHRYDGNDFLKYKRWREWSAGLTWNVLNVILGPERIEHAEIGEKITEMQRLALRMAVLTQVHVAERQFRDTLTQFRLADKLSQVNREITELVKTRLVGDRSVRDFVYEQTSVIASRLRRYRAYAELEAAYGRIHATLGLDIAPKEVISDDLRKVTESISDTLSAWKSGDLVRRALAKEKRIAKREGVEGGEEETLTEWAYFMPGMEANEAPKISLKWSSALEGHDKEDHDRDHSNGDNGAALENWRSHRISTSISD
uniref:Outer membrane protein TolC n=1 Tax=Candidatus Kentrum sp. TC TaxID=2126339 RepID=A0A450YW21_9GAMM|nr:MAG: Outer membrane protein TolC [Candidatus Kentron sp. TC]